MFLKSMFNSQTFLVSFSMKKANAMQRDTKQSKPSHTCGFLQVVGGWVFGSNKKKKSHAEKIRHITAFCTMQRHIMKITLMTDSLGKHKKVTGKIGE